MDKSNVSNAMGGGLCLMMMAMINLFHFITTAAVESDNPTDMVVVETEIPSADSIKAVTGN